MSHPSLPAAALRRLGPPAIALALLAPHVGCGDDGLEQGPAYRPTIDAGVTRCGPAEIAPLDHTTRILPLPDGDLLVLGNSFDPFHIPSGHMVRFDPTGQRLSTLLDLDRSIAAATPYGIGFILTDSGGESAVWSTFPLARTRRLLPTVFDAVTAQDSVLTGDGTLFIGGYERLGQSSPRTPSVLVYDVDSEVSPTTVLFTRRDAADDGVGSVGEITGLAEMADTGLVMVAGIDASPGVDPQRFGFLAVIGEGGRLVRSLYRSQVDFEPLRLVRDLLGQVWVLAVEDHQGDRYVNARPFMARIDPMTLGLDERITVPLPDDASQGALIDAVQLPDGGWIVGGSACGEARAWCQAWVGRLDVDGRVLWSRRTNRDIASSVSALHVVGQRIIAALSSSTYCCQWRELHQDGWLWALELDGSCPVDNGLRRDGRILR